MTLFYIHETQMTTCKMNENHNGDYALISPKIITEIQSTYFNKTFDPKILQCNQSNHHKTIRTTTKNPSTIKGDIIEFSKNSHDFDVNKVEVLTTKLDGRITPHVNHPQKMNNLYHTQGCHLKEKSYMQRFSIKKKSCMKHFKRSFIFYSFMIKHKKTHKNISTFLLIFNFLQLNINHVI